jgi:GTP pyrophosphokinase
MQKQKVPFEGVYDVFAIRFIIDCDVSHDEEVALCWKAFSYVTKEYEQDTNRLRDWLTKPKPNGYESLHITVKNKDGAYIEVQIRTKRMDDEAENGHAAHWSYKGIKHEESIDRWMNSVRYNLEHPAQMKPEDVPRPPEKEIFVFTPSGELRILPKGSSVLDFAFNIHSGLGVKCIGGKVNGKAVPIKEKLKTGDVVEIMSGKNQKPARDWLNWVVSSKARNKIRQMLHEAEYEKAAQGKEILERRLKNWKLDFPDGMKADFIKKNHFDNENAFFAAIGDGTLDLNLVKEAILEADTEHEKAIEEAKENETAHTESAKAAWESQAAGCNDDILVINAKNLKGLDYKMAKCCNPVFGDDVFGFVTRDKGITIHRISCPNASRLISMYPYRIQRVRWADTPSSGSFQASIKIEAAMEQAVLNQIMETTVAFKASVRDFHVSENQRNGTYDINMKISVPSNGEIDKVISQLKLLKYILKVRRG